MKSASFLMNTVLATAAALALVGASGCGNKIGDSCSLSTDCATEGGRSCDIQSPGGYCTIAGCDLGTCPEEAECVQFYSVIHLDKTCTQPSDCSLDEVCTSGGYCAQATSGRRFCMLRCGGHGDCREGYECRDAERRNMHGGEPLMPEGSTSEPPSFCAAALPCTSDDDCDLGDVCNEDERRCTRP